jgi:hypothetical protein
LKILIVIKQSDEFENSHAELADNAIKMLDDLALDGKSAEVFSQLKTKWRA